MKTLILLCLCMITVSCMAQNVGVGVDTPAAKFHAVAVTNVPAGLFEANSATFLPWQFGKGVLMGKYTGSELNHVVGVYGLSAPADGYGFGGVFKGGNTGALGIVYPTGSGFYAGLQGAAQGGGGTNAGVYGYVSSSVTGYGVIGNVSNSVTGYALYGSSSSSATNYGLYASATGSGTNYAIYGEAYGSPTDWAGFFPEGNVFIQDRLGIGNNVPLYKLHVTETTAGAKSIWGENTNTGINDGYGVYGSSVNSTGNGVGVQGDGGWKGVWGFGNGGSGNAATYGVFGVATGTGTGLRIGIYGTANGSSSNNYGVYCAGAGVYTGSWSMVSDRKFKKDITPVNGALRLIGQLQPVSYLLRTDEYPVMHFPSGRQYGFIAQEMENIIPLLVENGKHPGETKEEIIEGKTINYIGLIPVLTKAIQEQQQMIEKQQQTIEEMRQEIKALRLLR